MTTSPTTATPEAGRGPGLTSLLRVIRRRRSYLIAPFALVLAATVTLAVFLPSLWSAKAVVGMDRQRMPESLIKSEVAGDLERQLLSLSQEIISRPRLLKIIADLRLYPDVTHVPNDALDRMRRDITIDLIGGEERSGPRDDSPLVAFSVAYRALDPQVAMAVANRLAELYVEENRQNREAGIAQSSQSLENQLAEVRGRMQEQERRVAEYKKQHLGELPEQREENFRTLKRLQQQLQMAQENLRRANERRQLLAQTLTEIEHNNPKVVTGSSDPDVLPARTGAGRLALLRQELNEAIQRGGEQSPEAAMLRVQIASQEAQMKADVQTSAQPRPPTNSEKANAEKASDRRPARDNPSAVSLMQQLDQSEVEAKTLRQDIAVVSGQIGGVQRRLENTPRREQELAQLTQDHDALRERLSTLMNKRGEAGISAALKERQKGDTFRIVESAVLPSKPVGPNRLRLVVMGLGLALGLSGLAVMLAEQFDTSYHGPDEVRASLAVPVLSTIPTIVTDSDWTILARRRRYATFALAGSLVAVVVVTFGVARSNDFLATMLSPTAPPATRR
jgi:succinoglycan biosynthesis transport protein ExoP